MHGKIQVIEKHGFQLNCAAYAEHALSDRVFKLILFYSD